MSAASVDTTKVSHRQPISNHIGVDEEKLRSGSVDVEMISLFARQGSALVADFVALPTFTALRSSSRGQTSLWQRANAQQSDLMDN
jgi:hypothetical protein